jgi:hypothetical protein
VVDLLIVLRMTWIVVDQFEYRHLILRIEDVRKEMDRSWVFRLPCVVHLFLLLFLSLESPSVELFLVAEMREYCTQFEESSQWAMERLLMAGSLQVEE